MSTSRSSKPQTVTRHIDQVIPYWRNPRKISEEAIEGVQQSIETFGYVQPIVVDEENVIVIGHTRYQALRRLGAEEIEVIVSYLPKAKINELRIIDNKTHEYSEWDFEKLDEELKHFAEDDLIVQIFPEAQPTDFDFNLEEIEVDATPGEPYEHLVEFICPSCWHEWEATITREHVLTGEIHAPAEAH